MREFFFNTSLIAVAAAILKLASPAEKQAKQLSFLITCFFFVSVAGFAFGGKNSAADIIAGAGKIESGYTDFSYEVESEIKKETEEVIARELREELKAHEIFPENISVTVNISDNNSISINEIRLAFKRADIKDGEKCVQIIREKVGEETEIRIEIIEV